MKKLFKILLVVILLTLVFGCQTGKNQGDISRPGDGFDGFVSSLLRGIAADRFDKEKKPVIKVAVFDFTDEKGDITAGSLYLTNRVRLALGRSTQFDLLHVEELSKKFVMNAKVFDEDARVRDRLITDLKADVYLFGEVRTNDPSLFVCKARLRKTAKPFTDPHKLAPPKKEPEEFSWRPDLTDSGYAFFREVLVRGAKESDETLQAFNLSDVIFLTQPMCDDLNLSWDVKSDGMIYDRRKESDSGTLRDRTGQVMQSRVKSPEALKELGFVIKNFALVIKETGGKASKLQSYILPTESNYYYIPYMQGKEEWGLRFLYLWNTQGRSEDPSAQESGKGWQFYMASEDWSLKMPVGVHTATATLKPVAETEFGSKLPRSEFVTKFKFSVRPGLNLYVINYVYRRDRPEIFVRRLEIVDTKDKMGKGIKKITAVYKVYGLD